MHTIRIALVVGAVFALTACGEKDNQKPSSPPASAATDAAASKAPSPPDAAPAPPPTVPPGAIDAAVAAAPPDAAPIKSPADAAPKPVKKNSGPTKNLKVLSKKWSRKKVNAYMKKRMNKGLGVKCGFCHEKDDHAANTKHKKVALDMLKMTKDINRRFFKGKSEVTCYTCHLGDEEPPK